MLHITTSTIIQPSWPTHIFYLRYPNPKSLPSGKGLAYGLNKRGAEQEFAAPNRATPG